MPEMVAVDKILNSHLSLCLAFQRPTSYICSGIGFGLKHRIADVRLARVLVITPVLSPPVAATRYTRYYGHTHALSLVIT